MLVELHIENLGVIEHLDLVLGPGFTVLTGETGAGKTMLVEAIELLLGESVEQVMTIVEGSPTCEYIVSKFVEQPVRATSDVARVGGQDD